MIALIQRVSRASVEIEGTCVGKIDRGIMALIGIEKADHQSQADRLLHKLLSYRIFPDDEGKMNHGLLESDGGLLLIPQFTLAAETRKGLRPGFSSAAAPADGKALFEYFVQSARPRCKEFGCGIFGADMQVSLINDGPVTFWLQI